VQLTERFIVDLGVRWDRHSHLPSATDDRFSPRASLLLRVNERTDVRLSHGRFFQAESLLDLPVEDGVTEFRRAQRAVHSVVSVERRLAGSIALRGEWYRKRTRNVRPRFENLFDPLVVAPELRSSRILVAPQRAEADGLELTVSGEAPVSWWFGLSLANADDVIADVLVPRSWDQERGANAGVTWPAGRWIVSAAASAHRGWPVTELAVVTTASGERIAVAGPRNSVRNPSVRRLDVRLSRDFALGDTSLRFSAEIQNLTNRVNACCLAYEPTVLADGSLSLLREERGQGGITGNVGLLWQF
jgi:outer membrane receptor protein involved in Fe transport